MKTFLNRIVPLILCITVGMLLSWTSIYAFWFADWTFHSVRAAQDFGALGNLLLSPAQWVFERMGGDQTTVFFDPVSFAGTNGLILGILFYCVYRGIWGAREAKVGVPREEAAARRHEERVG